MDELWAHVIPLALAAAVSPTVLAVNLLVLGSPVKPLKRGAVFVCGGFLVIGALTFVALTGLVAFPTSSGSTDASGAAVDLVCALLLVALGLRALLKKPSSKQRQPSDGPLFKYLGLGVGVMLTNFTTIVLYVPAMKAIAHAPVTTLQQAEATLVVLAITTLTLWVPLLFTAFAPKAAARTLGSLNHVLTTHQRAVSVAVCFGFAVFLAVKGFGRL